MGEFGPNNEQELSPAEKRQQKLEGDIARLEKLRESGELSPENFSFDRICGLREYELPITRSEVGNHAVVISLKELNYLGELSFVRQNGQEITLESDDTGVYPIIIFPEDLGEVGGE